MDSCTKMIFALIEKNNILDEINLDSIPEEQLLESLVKNQILFPFFQILKNTNSQKFTLIKNKIKNILDEEYLVDTEKKTEWTLELFDRLNVKCMLHKFPHYSREQSDIDVLIPLDKETLILEELKKENFIPIDFEPFKTAMSKKQGKSKFTIHVHTKIKWESEFISTLDVWQRSQTITYSNHSIQIPSFEDAVLIECAHSIFENRVVRFCDLFQFVNLLKNEIDWNLVLSRLVYYNFPAVGFVYLHIINELMNDFFSEKSIPNDFLLKLKKNIPKIENEFCIKPILKELKSRNSMPIKIKLTSSAILFLTYNRRLGVKKFFWALNILFSAGLSRLKNS
jgi:hypothetical protein